MGGEANLINALIPKVIRSKTSFPKDSGNTSEAVPGAPRHCQFQF
jgi:hypothetical protein